MTSGMAKTRKWVLEYAPASAREVDPLMGWTSSSDTQTQVRLKFDTKEEALDYAKDNGIDWEGGGSGGYILTNEQPGQRYEFERNPNLKDIVAVRYLDEAGKRKGMETPEFWHFAPMVQRMVDRHCGADA